MKNKFLIVLGFLLSIPMFLFAQWAEYKPLTQNEILAPALIMRQRHDAVAKDIEDMMKYINSLKSQTLDTKFLSTMNSYLNQLSNIYKVLEEKGVNAVNKNSLSQIYNNVQEEISKYNVRIEHLDNYMRIASNAMNDHRYSIAIDNLSKAIDLAPDNAELYRARGHCYLFGINKPDDAIYDFIRYNQRCKNNSLEQADSFFLLGFGYEMSNQFSIAISNYSRCITIDNSFLDAYYRRGIAKSGSGDRQGAIVDYDYIINYSGAAKQNFKNMATVYNNKAYCLVELGSYDNALFFVEKALSIDNNIGYIWDTRGEIYYHKKNYSKCIADMDKAISLSELNDNGSPYNSYYYRGLAKIFLGKKTDGCADLTKAEVYGNKKAREAKEKHCL